MTPRSHMATIWAPATVPGTSPPRRALVKPALLALIALTLALAASDAKPGHVAGVHRGACLNRAHCHPVMEMIIGVPYSHATSSHHASRRAR